MNCLFVMDPIETIHPYQDTTLVMMLAAQNRGHGVFYCGVADLVWDRGEARARSWPVTVRRAQGNHVTKGDPSLRPLGDFGLVFMRKDPPVDMTYLHACYVLERAPSHTRVVNDPVSLRSLNEKLYALHFPALIPATIVSCDVEEILSFCDAMGGTAVAKPIEGRGGEGVFLLDRRDRNHRVILESMTRFGRQFVIAQRYLPEVLAEGDKRLIVIDGEPAGAVLRRPAAGDFRANVHVGGSVVAGSVDERDREICATLGADLRRRGVVFAGLDVIGGHLIEINITSPTLVQEIAGFSGVHLEERILDAALALRARAETTTQFGTRIHPA